MAESIEYLLSKHELREEMGVNARLRALDAFGIERFIADIANLYGRIWEPGAEVRYESRSGKWIPEQSESESKTSQPSA
jgi:hypothetical protein